MNDLDTPRAMQRLRTIEKDQTLGSLDKRAIFLYADQVLGLDLTQAIEEKPLPHKADELLAARSAARAAKDWRKSDQLRDELAQLGLEIKDGPDGQSWSWL